MEMTILNCRTLVPPSPSPKPHPQYSPRIELHAPAKILKKSASSTETNAKFIFDVQPTFENRTEHHSPAQINTNIHTQGYG